ncbi:MAG TPA: hypothetical protein VEJ63_02685 [Planctomycetota bacterium]|nr:hypothetical protein [Planctomycetota bacterium]
MHSHEEEQSADRHQDEHEPKLLHAGLGTQEVPFDSHEFKQRACGEADSDIVTPESPNKDRSNECDPQEHCVEEEELGSARLFTDDRATPQKQWRKDEKRYESGPAARGVWIGSCKRGCVCFAFTHRKRTFDIEEILAARAGLFARSVITRCHLVEANWTANQIFF